MSEQTATLSKRGLGSITFSGELNPEQYASAIYALSAERGFDLVIQTIIGLITTHEEFDDEIRKISAMEEGELAQYFATFLEVEIPEQDFYLNVELKNGMKIGVKPEPEGDTVRDMMALFFGLCTLEVAANIARSDLSFDEDHDDYS